MFCQQGSVALRQGWSPLLGDHPGSSADTRLWWGSMNWDDLTKEELLSRFLQLEERIDELEEQLIQKNEQSDKQAELIENRRR